MKQLLLLCFFFPTLAFSQTGTQYFQVDMRRQAISANGVHIAGNFQSLLPGGTNWDPAATEMQDPDGDSVYTASFSLPYGSYQYKFINGNAWAGAEAVPASCGQDDGSGNINRQVQLSNIVQSTPNVCFSACVPCSTLTAPRYTTNWWHDAVFYEVFVRSFYDDNGDGRGDFAGLTAKLDYLNDGNPATTTDLGITAIWLMPIMPSPSYHGYDVTNYKGIESDYGTMAQFDAFLAAAHARGIKVIIDLVLNHTSSQHPWFTQSASSTNGYRNWYVWSPTDPNYTGPWGQGVWHSRSGSFFYGIFAGSMPDLNWSEPAVRTAMWDVTRFWLNKGVDGFRLDAVKYLDENGRTMMDTPETFALLEEFTDTVKAVNPNAFTVGEAWSSTSQVIPYVQDGRLDACFEFDLALAIQNAVKNDNAATLTTQLNRVANIYPQLRYGTFLSNHDQNRVMSELSGSVDRMKQAASLYLTMPGVPFIYYGEEVGMTGTGGDENKRTPMQWTAGARAGFSTATPWRSVNSDYATKNVATMEADPNSLLNHYRKLISIRNGSEALRKGYLQPVNTNTVTQTGYARIYGQEAVIAVSFFGSPVTQNVNISMAASSLLPGDYNVTELMSGQAMGTLTVNSSGGFPNWLAPRGNMRDKETVILRLVSVTATAPSVPAITLSISPNPAATQVEVRPAEGSGKTHLRVINAEGKPVATVRFSGSSYTMDVSAWPAGVYFVQAQRGKAIGTERIVVER